MTAPTAAPASSDVVDVDPAGTVVDVDVTFDVVVAADLDVVWGAAVVVSAAVDVGVSAATDVGAGPSPQADSRAVTARAPRTASRRTRRNDIPITPGGGFPGGAKLSPMAASAPVARR